MLPRKNRLTGNRDFKRVFANGKTVVNKLLVLKVLQKSGELASRFAFSASAKFRKSVNRNRAKRLLRETVRLAMSRIQPFGFDAVMIARPLLRETHFDEVSANVEDALRKAGLLIEPAKIEDSGDSTTKNRE